MLTLYNVFINIYFFAINLAALFRNDARNWVNGRKKNIQSYYNSNKEQGSLKSIWFHAASLGEFEQGRPLIELIKSKNPNAKIIVSFFSPSGYNQMLDYPYADSICYFLSDQKSDIAKMIDKINPSLVIFIKYEFWFNTLQYLQFKKIPTIFISSIFRKDHYLFSPLSKVFVQILQKTNHIFLQDAASFEALQKHNFLNITIGGDTRIDRTLQIASTDYRDPVVDQFCFGNKILVCGSLWNSDFEIIKNDLANLVKDNYKIIIAPHKIQKDFLYELEIFFEKKLLLLSNSRIETICKFNVLVIDSIGLLARIYRYATCVYIGGGFGQGIHNILEPLAYHKPVLIGPKYSKFHEAKIGIERSFVVSIHTQNDLCLAVKSIDNLRLQKIKSDIELFLNQNKNATENIYNYLIESKLISQ